jgi:hypothetical protein
VRDLRISRHRMPALIVFFAAALAVVLPSSAAAHQPPTFTSPPVVVGTATVGSSLTAVAQWTQGVLDPGDPPVTVTYQWQHCPVSGVCLPILGATAATYTVAGGDLGQRVAVAVHLHNSLGDADATSPATDVVTLPPAQPDPTAPPPSGPGGGGTGGGTTFDTNGSKTTPTVITTLPGATPRRTAARPTYLRPFPVVRIRGFVAHGGARVTLLSVSGSRRATVRARCSGRGCPKRSVGPRHAPARLRAYEGYLRAGIVLEVRVADGSRIGKYTRFRIRAGHAPQRSDACLMPHRTVPAHCPVP